VIPVEEKPPPPSFDERVREPALRWLEENQWPLSGPVPKGRPPLKPFWLACLDELYDAYGGVCAYVAIRINRVTGARSTEHYVAKSAAIEDAYRWSNYRLVCQRMNSRKGKVADVLDPFEIAHETFVLNLLDGSIAPGPAIDPATRVRAQETIDRLGLDDGDCRRARLEAYTRYLEKSFPEEYLREECPFAWYEARRQGALR
jgi:hypothetical protein